MGEPLVNAFARLAEVDDRGKAFAIEVERTTAEPDREPWIAFCFDITIAPGPVDAAALAAGAASGAAFQRAVRARTELFLPTTIERVWWLAARGRVQTAAGPGPRTGERG